MRKLILLVTLLVSLFAASTSLAASVGPTPNPGTVLTAPSAVFSGTLTPMNATTYQWKDCNSTGGKCVNITGATQSTYTVQSSDVGFSLRVSVTGVSAYTPVTTNPAPPPAPVNTTGPYFNANSSAVVGSSLTVTPGIWTNSPTLSYQWNDCATTSAQPPTTGSCTPISGATSASYTVQASDAGHSLVPTVTGTNAGGSASTSLAGSCNTGEMLGTQAGNYFANGTNVPTSVPAGCSPISAVAASTFAGETFCTNAVTTCGFADPLNHTTGVPASTTLSTTGACAAYASGAHISSGTVVIDGCQINGQILVTGTANVTVQNSDVALHNEDGGLPGIEAYCTSCSLSVNHDTIHGLDPTPNGSLAWAIYDRIGSPAINIDHVFVYNVDRIFMNLASSGTPTVTNSFCWSNAEVASGGSEEHSECIYTQPPSNLTVKNSTLLDWRNQTAANYLDVNTGSCCTSTNDVENDLLAGGSYTVYGGYSPSYGYTTSTADTYRNNRFSRALFPTGGYFGISAYESTAETTSGNVYDDTGAPASP